MIRADQSDVIYQTEEDKFDAVVDDIAERHETGRPVLVGTTSVEKSEMLSDMLKRRGIKHEVLNAKYHEREAEIIAQAGRKRRGHDRHQHGRPRHRHHAGRQPRVHRRPRAAPARPVAGRDARRTTRRRGRRRSPRPKAAVAEEHEEVVAAAACT